MKARGAQLFYVSEPQFGIAERDYRVRVTFQELFRIAELAYRKRGRIVQKVDFIEDSRVFRYFADDVTVSART